ncbi:hypothetical protein B9G69_009910 [Bdellovibrio sp. SKB1291214]|uniref:hypothetical protein n=1 Tax=Bdellovibrio sp. SKB1291214 TaxID=1732569 RepID=UPI000B516898|nr:hypothetical protein [Bdellovibrio sp. SKB1291214]UYL07360.1 hypothetical protein B9G69_009910 [Bdellovibrio sp. SKB1291214]
MWLILKILFSSIAFAIRYSGRSFRVRLGTENTITHEGIEVFSVVVSSKNGTILNTTWNREFKCPTVFKLTRESRWDRFFKSWGLAEEIQTQDLPFDNLVYIACDSTSFMRKIQQDRETRQWVMELFNSGCKHISCDGNFIRAHFPGDTRSDIESAKVFATLTRSLEELKNQPRDFDPFFIKAVITESFIWGLAGYTLVSFLQWINLHEDIYLDANAMAKTALLCTGILSICLVSLILFLFKGSSRGHRIIVESILVLALCLPTGGIAIFSDININLDRSYPYYIDATIEGHYTQMHRRRRGNHYITYHLQLAPDVPNKDFELPLDIQVSNEHYEQLQLRSKIRLDIGRGKLRQPWIRSITAR